jgi:serine/threonine-protein kinase
MSPEQAKGKEADKRTDIWAFGCILYECLTGKRAFEGETVSETMASILKDEPDWNLLPSSLHVAIRLLLRRCLRKDPRQRLQSIGDARIELTEEHDTEESPQEIHPTQKKRLTLSWWIIAAVCLIAIVGWLLFAFADKETDFEHGLRGLTKFTIELPKEQQVYVKADRPVFVISNDGRRLAWIGNGVDSQLIYTRDLKETEVKALEDTRGLDPSSLAISPDSRWIAFQKDGSLMKVPFEGGTATPLVDTSIVGAHSAGFDWGEGDKIVVVISSVLYLFDRNGGTPVQLTELDTDKKEVLHYNPRFVPGGKAIIFSNNVANWNTYKLEAVSLDTGERTELVDDAYTGYVTSSGYLLFGRDKTIYAVPFDIDSLKVKDSEVPIFSSVQMQHFSRVPAFAVSPNGSMVFIPDGQGILQRRLVWIGRDGKREPLPEEPNYYFRPVISPDGAQLLAGISKSHYITLNTYRFDQRVFTPLSTEKEVFQGIWSPEGDHLIVSAYTKKDPANLHLIPIEAGGTAEPLMDSPHQQFPWSWSRDGRFVAFTQWHNQEQHYDIWLLPLEGENQEPILLMDTDENESQPCFSPNGRWIAYLSQKGGDSQIFVQEIRSDGSKVGKRHKVSRVGGWEPRWAPSGRELFYLSQDGSHLLSVDFDPDNIDNMGVERILLKDVRFPAPDVWGEYRYYDVTPDGQRFIVLLEDLAPERTRMVVVLNWLEELKSKMGNIP